MEYLRGWRALRADPQWMMKILLMLVLSFIPLVGNIVITGFCSLAMRRAASGQDTPLPPLELDIDYGMKLLTIGFKGFLVALIWSLPLSLLGGALGMCVSFGSVYAQLGGEEGAMAFLIILCVVMVLFPFVITVLAMPIHIAVLRAEMTGDIKLGMDFKGVLSMTKGMAKELLIGGIVMQLLGFVVVFVGLASCYVLLLPLAMIHRVIYAYWLAEVYKAHLEKGGEPLPIGPLEANEPEPMSPAAA